MDKNTLKIIAVLFVLLSISFAGNIFLLTKKSPDTIHIDPGTQDSIIALQTQIDSLKRIKDAQYQNLNHQREIQLDQQRQYYEKQIKHARTLSADSTLQLFTAITSRRK